MSTTTHSSVPHASSPRDPAFYAVPDLVGRLQRLGLGVGVLGVVACAIGFFVDPDQFYFSWLVGCTLWLGVSLGSLALLMVHHLTSGAWGIPARRVFEAAAGVLPLLAILYLPILAGMEVLYEWTGPAMDANPILAHKAAYLNETGFTVRYFVYWVLWIGLAFALRRLSLRQDAEASPTWNQKMTKVAAPGLVLYAFVTTFAYFDWFMSLEPLWFSTIYGVYFFAGAGLSSLAFLILVTVWLSKVEPMRSVLAKRHLHDWAKLLFAFIMLWAYFAFSQFLITWSGNLPEEIEWYLHRTHHGWGGLALFLILFHFAVPFALLLSRDLKKKAKRIIWVAGFLIFMRWVDLLWQVAPVHHESFYIHWLDVAAPLAVGGLWLAAFVFVLRRAPLLPPNDPYLLESVGEEAHGHE